MIFLIVFRRMYILLTSMQELKPLNILFLAINPCVLDEYKHPPLDKINCRDKPDHFFLGGFGGLLGYLPRGDGELIFFIYSSILVKQISYCHIKL